MLISLLLTYFFKARKSILLWGSLLFTLLCIGSKQDTIAYMFPILVAQSYLIVKHYVKYYQIPHLHYKIFSHVCLVFLILLITLYGSVMYINKQADTNGVPFWRGQLEWDIMGTIVYAGKNLYYPTLINQQYKNKITDSKIFGYIQKDFDPSWNRNIWAKGDINKILVNFSTLNTMQKVFLLNQLASNPIAYLFHRFSAAKAMLATSISNPLLNLDPYWTQEFNINSTISNIHQIEIQLLKPLLDRSPRAEFFYLILILLFILAITKLPPFNTYRNQLERYSIIILSTGSLLLFSALFFLSPGKDFRYHLLAAYSAEIAFILFLRSLLKKSYIVHRNNPA